MSLESQPASLTMLLIVRFLFGAGEAGDVAEFGASPQSLRSIQPILDAKLEEGFEIAVGSENRRIHRAS